MEAEGQPGLLGRHRLFRRRSEAGGGGFPRIHLHLDGFGGHLAPKRQATSPGIGTAIASLSRRHPAHRDGGQWIYLPLERFRRDLDPGDQLPHPPLDRRRIFIGRNKACRPRSTAITSMFRPIPARPGPSPRPGILNAGLRLLLPRKGRNSAAVVSGGYIWTGESSTSVDLVSFGAYPTVSGVFLRWKTGTESENAGFHVWRATAKAGAYSRGHRFTHPRGRRSGDRCNLCLQGTPT